MSIRRCAALAVVAVALVLQGCGPPAPTPPAPPTPPTPPTPTPASPTPAPQHKLNPIEVQGQHLYDSVTKKPFFAVGIAFPNLMPDDPAEWVKVLQRIAKESASVNMVRLYEVPPCLWNDIYGSCFKSFMEEADKLGIYVIFPGTGSVSGYIPRDGWTDAQDCYQKGEPLDMGRGIVQRAYYPNTLAIMIGNEFFMHKKTFEVASVFKAYARDLKAYMKMCNDDAESPSHGAMRQIPVMYAARDFGDAVVTEMMSYMKCGSADISIDIFGLNVERWCDPKSMNAYDSISEAVKKANLPGSFMFSEMGCPQNLVSEAPPGQKCRTIGTMKACPRNWNQVPPFFQKFTMFDGFVAYAYWNNGALNFNMLDSQYGNATIYADGSNFFAQTKNVTSAERPITEGQYPTCAKTINTADGTANILPLDGIKAYNEEKYPAKECPSGQHQLDIASFI